MNFRLITNSSCIGALVVGLAACSNGLPPSQASAPPAPLAPLATAPRSHVASGASGGSGVTQLVRAQGGGSKEAVREGVFYSEACQFQAGYPEALASLDDSFAPRVETGSMRGMKLTRTTFYLGGGGNTATVACLELNAPPNPIEIDQASGKLAKLFGSDPARVHRTTFLDLEARDFVVVRDGISLRTRIFAHGNRLYYLVTAGEPDARVASFVDGFRLTSRSP